MISNWVPIEATVTRWAKWYLKVGAVMIVYAQFFALIFLCALVAHLGWKIV